jgi:tetratricopeptide (TPR) repeat protein
MSTSVRTDDPIETAARRTTRRRRDEFRVPSSRTRIACVAACAIAVAFGAAPVVIAPAAQARAATTAAQCSAEQGQTFIDEGRYERAIREFTCLIEREPTDIGGYRGRSEANLLLGGYSDAYRDYARITAFVLPEHPDAQKTILTNYAARLAAAPDDVPALTGASFARWVFFDYAQAIHLLNQLLELHPDNVYSNLFRGSSRLLSGALTTQGAADLERAIALAPKSPDVRFIVADAYTYGQPDPERAYAEASLALTWGLDTPRVHAILASALNSFGEVQAAANHIQRHIELITTELAPTSPLAPGETLTLDIVPGRTYEIPVPALTGETLSIETSSKDFWDTIAVLLTPDGTPIVGSDDDTAYFAAFDWVAEETGTYRLLVTSFESVDTGRLVVARD